MLRSSIATAVSGGEKLKIDRLLSIIIYLLNRELVSARELAERFEVTVRTIQRDMEAIELAGIPIYTVQGPHGGYGIMETFKIDRSLISPEDFYYILTSLRGVSESLGEESDNQAGELEHTLEKIQSLVSRQPDGDVFAERAEKLDIDFSMLGGDPRHRGTFRDVRRAVDAERLVKFSYTNNSLEASERIVEPMTVAFRWRSWYLFGWCRLRRGYRLFRISRIKNVEVLDEGFRRRDFSFRDFISDQGDFDWAGDPGKNIDVILKFSPELRPLAEEFHETIRVDDDGSLVARMSMPDSGWMYGYILSWGPYVRVLEPDSVRNAVRDAARSIANQYS